jgi:hypothetical protein
MCGRQHHPPGRPEIAMEEGQVGMWKQLSEMLSLETSAGLQLLSALVILGWGLLFAHLFVVDLRLFETVPTWILSLVVVTTLAVIRVMLASTDTLLYGDSTADKYTRAFQANLPSRYIADKFGISKQDAEFYWYEGLFNRWSDPKQPRHSQWARTLRRGYACRFVYHTLVLLKVLIVLSTVLTLLVAVSMVVPALCMLHTVGPESGLGERISFIVVLLVFYLFVRLTNRTSPQHPSGVWRRFAEINQLHAKWIDENVASLEDLQRRARDPGV